LEARSIKIINRKVSIKRPQKEQSNTYIASIFHDVHPARLWPCPASKIKLPAQLASFLAFFGVVFAAKLLAPQLEAALERQPARFAAVMSMRYADSRI
jgi:hypothetical protein